MVAKGKKIWFDGELMNWDDANVHVLTHGLHYGTSVYEGIRAYKLTSGGGAIFRLKDHMARFVDSCRILQLQTKYTVDELCDVVLETVRANDLDECYIRPLAWAGEGNMGLFADNPTSVMVAAWPWGAYLGDEALNNGVKVHVSTYNRHHPNISMIRAKIGGQYVTGVLAKREAQAHGYHEAIMLDTHGYVAEGSGENIFAIKDGVAFTPPDSSPILPGFTRDCAIRLLQDAGVEVRKELFPRDFLTICDEIFLTGTAAEITPVSEVDRRSVGSGKPGPVTKGIQKAYFGCVHGENEKYAHWLDRL